MKKIIENLVLIEMSLTDNIVNPNFEANRQFALKKVEEIRQLLKAKE